MRILRLLSLGVGCLGLISCREAKTPEFSFGVMTDVQYANQDNFDTLHYRASSKKLSEAVDRLNQKDLAFVIHLGDFIDDDFESFNRVLPIWNQLKAIKNQVLGNHDYSVENDEKQKVPVTLGLKENYYDFAINPWRFLVLDGNDVSFHASRFGDSGHDKAKEVLKQLKTEKRINATAFNGGMSEKQLAWLRSKLKAACSANENVILFSHFPVYPPHRTNLWNNEEVRKVLEANACVVAYMNGHNHIGNYGVKNGIHYVTLHGMVETADTNAFAIVTVYQDRVEIKGFGREPNRILKKQDSDFISVPKPGDRFPVKAAGSIDQDFKIIPLEESKAYQSFKKRSDSDLSKLVFLLERFSEMSATIIYDGIEYETEFSKSVARRYLSRRYRKEKPAVWLKKHTYRSIHAGDVMMIRFPNGEEDLLRDILLRELKTLEEVSSTGSKAPST